jgi:predicted AAA+ superfamily ATPase
MIDRAILPAVRDALGRQAAVAVLGPRQVGKTTLALEIARQSNAVYLDLQKTSDRARLNDPAAYLSQVEDRLVILDEVHRTPDLFPVLRGVIDEGRRRGHRTGRFLILGSASTELLRQSGESLAGRISYLDMGPVHAGEVDPGDDERLWVRGGFPDSFLARTGTESMEWRQDLIRTYLERDIPQFGPRIPAETLRRFWTMLAHSQGGVHNAAKLGAGLEISGQTVSRYTDLLVDLFLVRRLASYHVNVGKRLVKSPKVYIRDSGLLHALLGIRDRDGLLGHPAVGGSWEGFVMESLLAVAPIGTVPGYYRTSKKTKMNLILEFPDENR